MKEQLILILIFSVFLNSFSQNYLSIKPDAVSFYKLSNRVNFAVIQLSFAIAVIQLYNH